MDPGLRTPLLDLFRRGEAARDIRLLAARGALAPRAHEQLALLVLLTEDPEEEIRRAADATLNQIPRPPLAAFIARSEVSAELRDFFGRRGIQPAEVPAADADEPLIDLEPELTASGEGEHQGTFQRLAMMGVSERIKVAMKGSREERSILIRDANKLVAAAVLSSPKLTESEVEAIAKMANVSEEVLRVIGHNRSWMKNYTVALGLARNPKTPLAISLHLVNRLNDRDVKMLSIDRNVQEPLRLAARKKVVLGEKK